MGLQRKLQAFFVEKESILSLQRILMRFIIVDMKKVYLSEKKKWEKNRLFRTIIAYYAT